MGISILAVGFEMILVTKGRNEEQGRLGANVCRRGEIIVDEI